MAAEGKAGIRLMIREVTPKSLKIFYGMSVVQYY
jgi:hypothetical protein